MSSSARCPWCALSPFARNFVAGCVLGASLCYIAVTFNPDVETPQQRHKRTHAVSFKTEELKIPAFEIPKSVKAGGGD
jgi:hypothetical protein